jgi:hypothetical protein
MIDRRDAISSPATASSLNSAWLRFTGKDNWVPTSALIYSCKYTELPEQTSTEVGHYHVTYSYEVNGERYIGRFADFGRQDESYFKRDDTIVVRYNPRDAKRSYYPELRTQTSFHLFWAAVGAGFGLVVIVWYTLVQHRPS